MNIWEISALLLLLGFVPCGWVLARGHTMDCMVAMQMAGQLTPLILLLLAQGFSQAGFADLALALALISLPAALLFAQFYERWL